MTDEQIVKAITRQFVVATILGKLSLHAKAQLFTVHALRLITTHRQACERWMKQRQAERAATYTAWERRFPGRKLELE